MTIYEQGQQHGIPGMVEGASASSGFTPKVRCGSSRRMRRRS